MPRSTIRKAVRVGRLSGPPSGWDFQWRASHPDWTPPASTNGPGRANGTAHGRRSGNGHVASRATSEAKLAAVRAEREQFRLERERGEWLRRSDVEREAFSEGVRLRDAILGVVPRVIPIICNSSEAEGYRLLDEELRATLAGLCEKEAT
mgnify:CR=1 FL=1